MDRRQRVLHAVEGASKELTLFLQELVRTSSVTGNEEPAQRLVFEKLKSIGAKVDSWKPRPDEFSKYRKFVEEE